MTDVRLHNELIELRAALDATRQENERLRKRDADIAVVFDQNNAYYAEIEQLRADLAAAVAALAEMYRMFRGLDKSKGYANALNMAEEVLAAAAGTATTEEDLKS